MVSEARGNNKAIILGYDEIIVSPYSTDSCNYCLSENEVEALLALLEYLYWPSRWESNSGLSLDLELIRNFADDLDYKLMSPCCDETPLSRFTEDGTYQESSDGGSTYHDAPSSDPRNSTVGFPPISGDDGGVKKCVASNSIITYYKGNVALIQAAKDSDATLADISAILVGILIVLGVISGGWLFAFIGELIGLIYANVTAETWEAAFDEDTWQDLLCIFYCNMSDDASFSLTQWSEVLVAIEASGFDPIAIDFFTQTMKGMRETGLTNAARSNYGGSLDCSGCSCDCGDLTFHVHQGTLVSQSVDDDGYCVLELESEYTGSHHDIAIYWNITDAPVLTQNGEVMDIDASKVIGGGGDSIQAFYWRPDTNTLGTSSEAGLDCGTGHLYESNLTGEGAGFTMTLTVRRANEDCSG